MQIYLMLSCCPCEGHIAGIVDAPNCCVTLAIPIAIFDQVSPCIMLSFKQESSVQTFVQILMRGTPYCLVQLSIKLTGMDTTVTWLSVTVGQCISTPNYMFYSCRNWLSTSCDSQNCSGSISLHLHGEA